MKVRRRFSPLLQVVEVKSISSKSTKASGKTEKKVAKTIVDPLSGGLLGGDDPLSAGLDPLSMAAASSHMEKVSCRIFCRCYCQCLWDASDLSKKTCAV